MTRSARGSALPSAPARDAPPAGARVGAGAAGRVGVGSLSALASRRRRGDRRAAWRWGTIRRAVAAVLAAAAVYAGTTALAPDPPDPGRVVLVAATDLPVGTELSDTSTREVHVPPELVPSGALTQTSQTHGRVSTAPVRDGEILTDLRVSPTAGLEGLDSGLVLAHLPLVDPSLAGSLRPGVRVDVLGTTDGSVLARDVLLAQRTAVLEESGVLDGGAGADAAGFLVAVTPEQASRLAAAHGADLPGHGLTVVIRG